MINYAQEDQVSIEEFIQVLNESTLGARRPVEDRKRIGMMIENASIMITARVGGKLIGIARAISDGAYCTYLSDLAVSEAYQKQGIGKALIRRTQRAAPQAKLILLSAPAATEYYPKIGLSHHQHCYYLADIADLV